MLVEKSRLDRIHATRKRRSAAERRKPMERWLLYRRGRARDSRAHGPGIPWMPGAPPPMMARAMAADGRERAVEGRWSAFAGWCALALLGQAALLGATQAGPRVTYHHLRIPREPDAAWWTCA